MKTLAIPMSDAFRPPPSMAAPLLRDIVPSRTTAASPSAADALAMRRLLATAWLGFGSFVAAMLTTIPEWTGFARYAWLVGEHFKPGAMRPSSQFPSLVRFALPDTNERRSPGVGH